MYNDSNRWSYQKNAIEKISRFFSKDELKKGLLVIPTGGGKTLTALRAINELYRTGVISKKVLWVSHLITLNIQTRDVINVELERKSNKFLDKLELIDPNLKNVQPEMVAKATSLITTNKKDYDFIVIDEAHHSASDGYNLLVGSGLPILGLTATPIRLDGKQLSYKKIIYQTTPSDLFERKVIIRPKRPEIVNIKDKLPNINFGLLNLSDDECRKLNVPLRNKIVVDTIFNSRSKYQKVILFVRTMDHAKALYDYFLIENLRFSKYYQKIGYIFGSDNDENISNKEYISKSKEYQKSIIINCGVLTEGFDDPSVNTVAMVCPSKSTTYLMQCVGRALRRNPKLGDEQEKYLVQFVDDLPNINYRFDNYWTYGEIDESLEPIIKQIKYSSKPEILKKINNDIIKSHPGLKEYSKKYNFGLEQIDFNSLEESAILLYNHSLTKDTEEWWLIYMNGNKKREFYLDKFNLLSANVIENMSNETFNVENYLERRGVNDSDEFLGGGLISRGSRAKKLNLWSSVKFSRKEIMNRGESKKVINRIKYYRFSKTIDEFYSKLNTFISECHNKAEVLEKIKSLDNRKKTWLFLCPSSIIGGNEALLIFDKTKIKILKLIHYFNNVVESEHPRNFNKLIDDKREEFYTVENEIISYENILLIINNKNEIFDNEEKFLMINPKK